MRTYLVLLLAIATTPLGYAEEHDPAKGRWADDMARFAQQDAEHPTPPGGVVFVGSSSIRFWDLEESFPDLDPPPLNRGFGGSQLADSIRHVELLVLKHKPRVVVVYAGDNDLAAGKSAGRVVDDFRKLTAQIHEGLPETEIAYIAIKPCTARWHLREQVRDANARIQALCEEEEHLTYVDIWPPMLTAEGTPRTDLLRDDGLHLTDTGYEVWTALVGPVIEQSPSETRDPNANKQER